MKIRSIDLVILLNKNYDFPHNFDFLNNALIKVWTRRAQPVAAVARVTRFARSARWPTPAATGSSLLVQIFGWCGAVTARERIVPVEV